MILLEIYFALTIIVFLITIPFYISRVKEFRAVKSQYSILILLIFIYTDYINMCYEMKEKFERKYLNKGKEISKK